MAEYDTMGNYTGYADNFDMGNYPTGPVQPQIPISYDSFGNPVYNDEEERRRREEELRQIEEYKKQQEQAAGEVAHKQEVTTYADGSQTVTTKREIPAAAPQVVAPIAPQSPQQAAYNASIAQQESGNRPDIGYHNRQLSSAYGPYGITQAAYADARRTNPNLPADITQATPEQMTAAQNAVTQNNAQYLQNYGVPVNPNTLQAAHFLGAKGLADYLKNGTISPQAAAANGGEANVRRIVEQRLGGQAAAASGAAQPAAVTAPVSPEEKYSLAAGMATQPGGLRVPGQAAPTATAQPAVSPFIEQYQAAQADPNALMKLSTDETAPEFIRERARNRAADLITEQRENLKAQETLAQASPTDLARYLQGKTKSGEDYNLATRVRAMLFAAAGQQELAMREFNKLDTTGTDKYVQGPDGKPYLIRTKANGEVMAGYNAETGKQLSPEDLVKVGAGLAGGKLNIVGGTYVNDKTGEVGRVITDERTGQSYIQTDTGRKPMTGFRPQSSTGTLEDQRTRTIQDINLKLRGKGVEEAMSILRDYNRQLAANGYPIVQPSEVGINVPQIGGGTAAAVPGAAPGPVVPPTAAAAPAVTAPVVPGQAPAAQPATAAAVIPGVAPGARPTGPQLAAQAKTAEEIAKEAGKVVAVSAETQNLLKGIEKATNIIDSGEHNIGSVLSAGVGRGPIAQAIGSQFETKDARNTKTVMDTVQKLAAEGLKSLGSNPSTADLQFWTKFKPDASSDPEFVKEWIQSRSEDLKRRLGYAEKQVEKGGQAGAAPEVKTEAPPMTPADKARAELERRRKAR